GAHQVAQKLTIEILPALVKLERSTDLPFKSLTFAEGIGLTDDFCAINETDKKKLQKRSILFMDFECDIFVTNLILFCGNSFQ
ncbi:MAG: hypothetical protein KA143_07495, partial [Saprospiraceae bacterium]|nr:hypothetical protein [Saprospiraceae bacterium]